MPFSVRTSPSQRRAHVFTLVETRPGVGIPHDGRCGVIRPAATPRAKAELAYQLVEGIALWSKVDWRARGLQDLGKPDGFHDRRVRRWTAMFERVKGRDVEGMDTATGWLRAHRPLDFVPGVMHGDYQWANVMYRHGTPARLAAIVDWEMDTIGDPELDLAWALEGWTEDTHAPGAGGQVTGP
ncbi:phosphotransferase family protein [Streptomyces gardneri]|nr:phosphotransferase family protein [Streptomyces gardneri]